MPGRRRRPGRLARPLLFWDGDGAPHSKGGYADQKGNPNTFEWNPAAWPMCRAEGRARIIPSAPHQSHQLYRSDFEGDRSGQIASNTSSDVPHERS